MIEYDKIKKEIENIKTIIKGFDYWIEDEEVYKIENNEMAPGYFISKYGFFVIGKTVGGNAITISEKDGIIRFCDHTGWYEDNMCWAAKNDYDEKEYNYENVLNAQIEIANSFDELIQKIKINILDDIIDNYD